MNNVSSLPTHKSCKQPIEPILSGNVPEDRALWHLSLVLREIAEKQETGAEKTGSQHQADAEDTVSEATD